MGLIVSPLCYFFVAVVKTSSVTTIPLTSSAFHGIGGLFGALATASSLPLRSVASVMPKV